ncbi:MAG: phosphate/phosphite/phosphonate ABC transporter substrate-binding protein [Nitrospirae bacterium]|nr:phosphate/phosphite/phosphonate ABC transporter substrate-binding protein [Nitrospirota bacterium]
MMLFILCFTVLLPFACTENEKQKSENPSADKDFPTTSFVIALLPEQNVFSQKRRYMPLAHYLSRAIDMNVKTKLLDSYGAIYSEILNNKVDAAFFGSLSYVVTNAKIRMDPIARPYQKDGTSTYRGMIFARRNSGITGDITSWKDKRIALVHKSTTAGYIFPMWCLYKKGVKNFEDYFSQVIFMGSHDAAILAVLNGDVDIGCASDQIFNKFLKENPVRNEKLTVLASSAPVPSNTLGIRYDRDDILKKKLRSTLLDMDKTPEGREALSAMGATHFIETKNSEFEPIHEMLDTLGFKPEDIALEEIGLSGKSSMPEITDGK